MPATAQHRRMTANALNLVPELPGPRSRLTEEFCLYPDQALNAPEEFARYCRLPSGEWFHYLPDVSYAELYRYHTVDRAGHIRRAHAFRNGNYDFALPGFLHLLRQSATLLGDGKEEEAMKYLGVLLHVLQDACFGIHALEGPGGSDLFFFDRFIPEIHFILRTVPAETDMLCINMQVRSGHSIKDHRHSLWFDNDRILIKGVLRFRFHTLLNKAVSSFHLIQMVVQHRRQFLFRDSHSEPIQFISLQRTCRYTVDRHRKNRQPELRKFLHISAVLRICDIAAQKTADAGIIISKAEIRTLDLKRRSPRRCSLVLVIRMLSCSNKIDLPWPYICKII